MSNPIVPAAQVVAPPAVEAPFEPRAAETLVEEPDEPLVVETPVTEAVAAAPDDSNPDGLALAEELEAALLAALEDSHDTEEPSVRTQRLTRALALANGELVEGLPAIPSIVEVPADSEYLSMLKSYGPFPLLLPEHRDFRPVLALSVFAGFLGADRFYEGKNATGALKLATAGGLGIWWIADIISILNGRAEDKDGHHFKGEKKHRAIAWALTAALFAGLTPVAANAVTPVVTAGTEKVKEALFPKPAPVPTWTPLAVIKGTPEPIGIEATGDRLRLTYNFPSPVYAYLQKQGDAIPPEPLLLKESKSEGTTEVAITPGKYQLVVRTEGTTWTAKVEELGLHG